MSTSSLAHIPAFHAVMRSGSLSAAARLMRQSQPTVRRHIEALETDLGVALFTRAANGLTPTAMAESLLPYAASVLEETAALARAASAQEDAAEGVVRLTTSRIVATHVMPQVLADLRRNAPGLRVELGSTDAAENMVQRAADIALRFTPPRQTALVAQRLADIEVGLFAADGLALPRDIAALQDAPFVADDRENLLIPRMVQAGLPAPRNIVLRCDDPLAQLAHVQAGLGIGFCQARLAARLGLVRVLPDLSHAMPCWLVVHEDQRNVARIRAVFDHLRAALPLWI
jgi:DNA-binding transcriptional LysR family regulator